MNNTTTTTRTKRNLTIVAIFMAATLVVGIGTFTTTTTTQSAFAYSQKKDNGKGNGNGNTVTIEECKNKGSASGFDTAVDQECENLICTHPGDNATCVQEGAVATKATTTTPPTPKTCEECFRSLLTPEQLAIIVTIVPGADLESLCLTLQHFTLPIERFEGALTFAGVSASVQAQLIQCLKNAGIVFSTES